MVTIVSIKQLLRPRMEQRAIYIRCFLASSEQEALECGLQSYSKGDYEGSKRDGGRLVGQNVRVIPDDLIRAAYAELPAENSGD